MPLATFRQDDHLGEIVIDSPPQNLYSAQLLADLRAAVDEAAGSRSRPSHSSTASATLARSRRASRAI